MLTRTNDDSMFMLVAGQAVSATQMQYLYKQNDGGLMLQQYKMECLQQCWSACSAGKQYGPNSVMHKSCAEYKPQLP